MILILATLLTILLNVTIGAHLTLWGGVGYYVPALIILAFSFGRWPLLLWALVIYGASALYIPLSATMIVLMGLVGVMGYVLFRTWISSDSLWLKGSVTSVLFALFLTSLYYFTGQSLDWRLLGSFILTAFVQVVWYGSAARRGHGA